MHRAIPFIILLLASPAWAQEFGVTLEARMAEGSPPLTDGMDWRVFRKPGPYEDAAAGLVEVAQEQGGGVTFQLPAGSYFIHAGFGQANRTLPLEVEGDVTKSIVLRAGGLKLDATTGGKPIANDLLRFDVFERAEDKKGERKIVAFNVAPGSVVRLNAATYHVLSRYGDNRTEVRADLVVRPGETTHAVMQHRGAEVRLRLASSAGGAAIANTSWSVFSDQGERILESSLNAPRFVLPEGDYEAVASNGELTLKHAFTIVPGAPRTVEILLP